MRPPALVVIGHDHDDDVIPVAELQCFAAALSGRAGVHYAEFGLFQHADPTKRKLPLPRLLHEFGKFYRFAYPLFRHTARKR